MVVSTNCLANVFLTKLTTGLPATWLGGTRRRGSEGQQLEVRGGAGSPQAGREATAALPLQGGTWGDWDQRWGRPHKVFMVVGAPREWGLWGPLEGSITLLWGWIWPHLNLLCLVWGPTSGALPRLQGKAPAWLCGCSSGWALMVLSRLISS